MKAEQTLALEVCQSTAICQHRMQELCELCTLAYGENIDHLFRAYGPGTHVLGLLDDRLVAHAMWVTRWLQPEGHTPHATAYVEAVATLPQYQGHGYGRAVMGRLADSIPPSYALAFLSPSDTMLYHRLGWREWTGPLSIRLPDGQRLETPEEAVMFLPLPWGPDLNPAAALSAEWREGEVW